jgi:hypothetical protein
MWSAEAEDDFANSVKRYVVGGGGVCDLALHCTVLNCAKYESDCLLSMYYISGHCLE